MQRGVLLRLGFCLSVLSLCLYSYQNKQNELTKLKIRLPMIEKEIRGITEENRRLYYEIDRVENPAKLIQLAHRPEYGHLKHPLMKEIMTMPEGIALSEQSHHDPLW